MVDNLLSRIEELKRRKGAVILAHYYTLPEVQAVADFLGDSLALSIEAQKVEARTILFAGVHFMAETAKVLCPDKKVLIPVPEASCSLADGCEAEAFRRFRARYPGHTVVSYVKYVGGQGADRYLLHFVERLESRGVDPGRQPSSSHPTAIWALTCRNSRAARIWCCGTGACHVHEEFSLEKLLRREEHPAARGRRASRMPRLYHGGSRFRRSTAAILDYCGRSDAHEFIVVTEAGILAEMQRRYPARPLSRRLRTTRRAAATTAST